MFNNFIFQDRWRSGLHIGVARPTCVVEIQGGRWTKGYKPWSNPIGATIDGESSTRPWRAEWEPNTGWVELPGVSGIQISQSFDQQGLPVASLTVENSRLAAMTGPMGGTYFAMQRGYLSPFRGYRAPGRPAAVAKTEWYDILAKAARVRIWQGYGVPNRNSDGSMPLDGGTNGGWTFAGQIDDIDLTAQPATMSITARAGKTMTDAKLFGWNKSRQLKDPVTFMDRAEADSVKKVGSSGDASSQDPQYPARTVTAESGGMWRSQYHTNPGVTEWVQIRLPKGRYSQFILDPWHEEMEMYVGVFIKGKGTVDGVEHNNRWVGTEEVPGEKGGWRYIRKANRIGGGKARRDIGAEIICDDNSILRIGFRRLGLTQRGFCAGVTRLVAERRMLSDEAKKNDYILVDDVADVVKVVLRWAGYTEWEVESIGVRLSGKLVFNRATFLMDIITKACEQTGNVFFLQAPSNGNSWGVPTWRQNGALIRPPSMIEVRDTGMLTAMDVKISEEPLPYIIRVRGAQVKGGAALGGDPSKRIMAVYRPPWWDSNRLAGIIKHSVHTQPELKTYEECAVACYLWAINAALEFCTATVETMGNPGIAIDDQISVVDTATGMNTRLWISNIQHSATYTETGTWKTAVGGALVDTPEMEKLIKEIDSQGLIGNVKQA